MNVFCVSVRRDFCLVCIQCVAVLNEYVMDGHYNSEHKGKYENSCWCSEIIKTDVFIKSGVSRTVSVLCEQGSKLFTCWLKKANIFQLEILTGYDICPEEKMFLII
jgi:hypothetical protein